MDARQADPVADRPRPTSARGLQMLLNLDALASGLFGVLLVLLGWAVLPDLLGYPVALLIPAGVGLLVFSIWLRYLATRAALSRAFAVVVIVINALWVLASVMLVLAGWFDPTALGVGLVLVQAVAVAGFAVLQYGGLRRAESALR